MIAPDDHVCLPRGRPTFPAEKIFKWLSTAWRALTTDPGAITTPLLNSMHPQSAPQVTWGTNPGMVTGVTGRYPILFRSAILATRKRLPVPTAYMNLKPGTALMDVPVDRVFIGSCTNSRLNDLRRRSSGCRKAYFQRSEGRARGARLNDHQDRGGSGRARQNLPGRRIRMARCGMQHVLGHESRYSSPGERAASTSNRNFEGRQGKDSRTHLVSPVMKAAAAIAGHFVDVREWNVEASE